MTSAGPSLSGRYAALQAERERDWEPAQVQANASQRRRLVETAAARNSVVPGDRVGSVSLQQPDGSLIELDEILQNGPTALVFFRFAGCPACNIALSHYQEMLAPGLLQRGVTLVAVTPQIPPRAQEIARRHGLSFPVLTDPGNRLARSLDIVFEPTEAEKAASLAKGSFIGDTTGTGTWELPMPAVVLIDRERKVHFADISPDWLIRSEAGPVLDAVDIMQRSRAA